MCLPTTAQGLVSLRAKVLILRDKGFTNNYVFTDTGNSLKRKNKIKNKVQAMKDAYRQAITEKHATRESKRMYVAHLSYGQEKQNIQFFFPSPQEMA